MILAIIVSLIVWLITKNYWIGIGVFFLVYIISIIFNKKHFGNSKQLLFQAVMLNSMNNATKKIVKKVMDVYHKHLDLYPQKEARMKTLLEVNNLSSLPLTDEIKNELEKYTSCIEGVCYCSMLNFGPFKNLMKIRCAQLCGMIDYELSTHVSYTPCSLDEKTQLYKIFDLYDIYQQSPSLFKWNKTI
jgi:hypothetical protein